MRRLIILAALMALACYCLGQTDTNKSALSFDLGWTRNKNINLWPVYVHKVTKEERDFQLMFPIFRSLHDIKNGDARSHLLPFYTQDSSAKGRDFRLLSLFYPSVLRISNNTMYGTHTFKLLEIVPEVSLFELTKSNDGKVLQNNFLFILLYNRNEFLKKSYLVFFPLYWSYKNPENTSTTFFPFYSKTISDSGKSEYLAVSPLFWHYAVHDKTGSILFPFFWAFTHNDQSEKVIFPFFWKKDNNYEHFLTVIPFFSVGHTTDSSKRYLAVTPLFWHSKSKDGHKNILFPFWWNLYRVSKNPYRISMYPKDSTYSYSASDTQRYNVLFPFYWHYSDINNNKYRKSEENKTTIIFPVLWKKDNSNEHSLTVIPFFSVGYKKDSSKSYLAITPLFWHTKNRNGHKNILFPVWWNSYYTLDYSGAADLTHDTTYSNVIFPFYWHYTSKDNFEGKQQITNNTIVFPLFWSIKNPYYKTFSIIPFYSVGRSADNSKNHLSITPLFWHFKKDDEVRNFLFPFFWSYKDTVTKNTVLFPFLWSYKNRERKTFTLFPFISFRNNTLFKEKYLVITPLFWHYTNRETTKNVLFPFWWHSNYKYDSSHSNVIFPFYWSYHNKNRNATVLFPFIWKFHTTQALNAGQRGYKSFTIAPLFSEGHSPGYTYSHLVITPLFWSIHKPGVTRTLFFPVFNYYKDTLKTTFNALYVVFRYRSELKNEKFSFLWPIVDYAKGADYKYFRFSPVIWYKKTPKTEFLSVQPVYTNHRDSMKEVHRILEELLTYKRYFNKKKSLSILWKLMTCDRYDNGDHDFRILYLLYANMHKEGTIEKSIFPFYHVIQKTNGNSSFSTLMGLFHSSKRQIAGTKEFYREVKIFWFIRILSNYNALKAKGINRQMLNKPT